MRFIKNEFEMRQRIVRKTEDEWVKDQIFILWCLFPTKELDKFFQDYLDLYPEDKAILLSAKNKVRKIRISLKQSEMTDSEYHKLKNQIEEGLFKRKRKQVLLWVSWVAAACITLFVTLHLFDNSVAEIEEPVPSLIAEKYQIDSQQKEIELHLANDQIIEVPNNEEILICKQGKVKIGNTSEEVRTKIQSKIQDPKEMVQKEHTLRVPYGRHSFLMLPDSSKVWVNAGTILRFPQQFDKTHRTIYVDGEIYLQVKKDSRAPFHVKTSQMDVRVLGTSFCVTAYSKEKNQSVILKEGLVSVNEKTGKKQDLYPNDMLVFQNGNISVQQVNPDNYISWINGFYQFQKFELGKILDQLSRYYKVTFYCPETLESFKFSGKLVLFDDLEQVLKTIQDLLPITYVHEKDTIKIEPVD